MKWLPLLLLVSGCATANRVDVWPLRGSLLEVRNPTDAHQVIIARDGQGREWQVARIKPQGRACFRWPFIDGTGSCAPTVTTASRLSSSRRGARAGGPGSCRDNPW